MGYNELILLKYDSRHNYFISHFFFKCRVLALILVNIPLIYLCTNFIKHLLHSYNAHMSNLIISLQILQISIALSLPNSWECGGQKEASNLKSKAIWNQNFPLN